MSISDLVNCTLKIPMLLELVRDQHGTPLSSLDSQSLGIPCKYKGTQMSKGGPKTERES